MSLSVSNGARISINTYADWEATNFQTSNEFNRAFSIFLETQTDHVKNLVWTYFKPRDIGILSAVCKSWKNTSDSDSLWSVFYSRIFSSENSETKLTEQQEISPARSQTEESVDKETITPLEQTLNSPSPTKSWKERYLETHSLFPHRIGEGFYEKYFGAHIKAPPIPRSFIDRAKKPDPFDLQKSVKDTHQLIFIPEEISIKTPENSDLILKEGRLVRWEKAMTDQERNPLVPWTIENMLMLTKWGSKEGHKIDLYQSNEDLQFGNPILTEYGNKSEKAHWSYQRIEPMNLLAPYQEQIDLAQSHHYEVVGLTARVALNLLKYLESGIFTDNREVRTSSFIHFQRPHQVTIKEIEWISQKWMYLNCHFASNENFCAAVEVALESSELEKI